MGRKGKGGRGENDKEWNVGRRTPSTPDKILDTSVLGYAEYVCVWMLGIFQVSIR